MSGDKLIGRRVLVMGGSIGIGRTVGETLFARLVRTWPSLAAQGLVRGGGQGFEGNGRRVGV